jgi:hypothetical protein
MKKWAILRDRLVEIAKIMRRFPRMVEVVRQRPVSILHPYMVEVYVAKDGSEAGPPNLTEGFLRPERRCEEGQARADIQQI